MKFLSPILSVLSLFAISCSTETVDLKKPVKNSSLRVLVDPTFMSANLNGIQYDNLKPFDYFNSSCQQSKVETYFFQNNSYNYLLLQGSDIRINDQPALQSVVINLRIPQSQWAIGTYELKDVENVTMNDTNSCVDLIEIGAGKKAKSLSGTMTITNFDAINRTIQGNFSLNYYLQNADGTLAGPYNLTDGKYKYALDDPFFD